MVSQVRLFDSGLTYIMESVVEGGDGSTLSGGFSQIPTKHRDLPWKNHQYDLQLTKVFQTSKKHRLFIFQKGSRFSDAISWEVTR